MKRFILLIGTLLISCYAYSQTLTGVVYDEATKKPIADANVYLDGTAIHTTTNANGQFVLNVGKTINTQLIISHITYDLISVSEPFKKLSDKFYLKEKSNILNEAVVITDKFTRKEKLKAFREQFLGTHKPGKSCKILNENDIKLFYNLKDNTFSAKSNNPIIVENEYLGYKVYFTLLSFNVTFNGYTLDDNKVKQSAYYGTSQFVDLKSGDKKAIERRDKIYEESSPSFFKNLVNDSLKQNNLLVFNRGYMVNPYNYFIIKDTLSQKLVMIDPESNIDKFVIGIKGETVHGKVSVLYKKKIQSEIVFLTSAFLVDPYGNITPVGKIYYMGHYGQQRLGYMLPLDYMPQKQ